MMETMVFRVRDPKDLMQLALEDSASAVTSPAAMLENSTPASRIKLERFGKSSVVLAGCEAHENAPAPNQSAYEPLFRSATAIIANYRGLLGAKRTVPDELSELRDSSCRQNQSRSRNRQIVSSSPAACNETGVL